MLTCLYSLLSVLMCLVKLCEGSVAYPLQHDVLVCLFLVKDFLGLCGQCDRAPA